MYVTVAPPRFADIEICSHCNARCVFCPVAADPLPRHVMSEGLFERILANLQCFRLDWIALNHYNEPLLDPGFWRKAEMLVRYGLRLRLFTNALLLTPDKARKLARLGIVESVVINIPSADAAVYSSLMGVTMPPRLLENIGEIQRCGYKVYLCVNGHPKTAGDRQQALQQALHRRNGVRGKAYLHLTHDRAGLVSHAETVAGGCWGGALGGCDRMRQHIHISVFGKVFLCCQDYYQNHVWGDLTQQTAENIWHGEAAHAYRQKICGETPAAADFICRRCVELKRVVPIDGSVVANKEERGLVGGSGHGDFAVPLP